MRVRISYGVEIEDLPALSTSITQKALDLLSRDLSDLQDINSLVASLAEHSPQAALEMTTDLAASIDKLRQTLSKVDQTLADFGAILEGYNSAANPEVTDDQLQ